MVVDATLGQRVMSALVDMVFFAVVGVLGFSKVIGEPTLAVLLGSYASARFGIAYGKQQTVVALASRDGRTDPPGGGTGGSQPRMPAVTAPIVDEIRGGAPLPREEPVTPRGGGPYDRGRSRREPLAIAPTSPFLALVRGIIGGQ